MTHFASSIREFVHYFEHRDEAGDKDKTRQLFGSLNHELRCLTEAEINGAMTLTNVRECALIERALKGVNNHRRGYRITNAHLDRVRLKHRGASEIPVVDEGRIGRQTEREVLDKWDEIITRHEAAI